ncbi:hypothetical protein [Haloarcula montana]|uniref:hypothetical protein n=1 Tax=Haloarcula montana TaxID=3111776 RepID=UPI002D77CDCE|nr:hypothetical protein [Haloarcula sp. GH36]
MIFGFEEEKFKKSFGIIFGVLLVTGFVPILNLVRIVPLFKEVALGAAVVAVFTSITDTKTAVKFALATGMLAAVAFNIVYIPGQIIMGGAIGAASGGETAMGSGAGMALLSGLGALTNLFGLLLFSPIGYTIGGVLGSVLNQ